MMVWNEASINAPMPSVATLGRDESKTMKLGNLSLKIVYILIANYSVVRRHSLRLWFLSTVEGALALRTQYAYSSAFVMLRAGASILFQVSDRHILEALGSKNGVD
jgi:hypothetical protein